MLEHQQRNWVLKFLMGLNDSITPIKTQIILIKPLPCLSEVYTLVQQEEKGKHISLPLNPTDTLSLVV